MNALINALRSRRPPAPRRPLTDTLRWRPAAGRTGHGPAHGIVVLVRVLLLFESAMYSAVAPVLPHYAHVLHASKPAVGLLTASYPAGIVPGSLIGAWIAARTGVRRTTLIGLLLFAVAIVGFGLGNDIAVLDGLRFAQGIGCGFIWGGGLTWVIAVAPRERRGAVLGSVIGAAIFGTLLGPVLGTLAVAVGTGPVFAVVGLVSFGLAAWTLRYPEPPAGWNQPASSTPLRTLAGTPLILLGAWLILLEAATVGATGTLIPLRLAHFGGSGILIGATFLVASFISMQVSTPIGRLVDRRGAGLPLAIGLSLTAVLMILLPLPQSAVGLAILSIIALGGPLTAYTVPAMSIITEASERVGVPLVMATMLLNLAWALGEVVGAPAAANISQATSDAVPLLMLSAIMVLTLWPVLRARLHRRAAPAAEARPAPRAEDPARACAG
ncbi:MAG TPA: MFS transporter [Solirubrobacteraceae bacterium]|nr:MFS transporter [Solirubrobacteraceae bacterium]